MPNPSTFPLVDEILQSHAEALGPDLPAYRNHVTRVLHLVFALAPQLQTAPEPVLIAGAFHDLGIWTAQTFDYLDPSSQLAHDYLEAHGQQAFWPEVDLIIQQHHKLRSYRGPFEASVEAFRRADLVDLSLGWLGAGLQPEFIGALRAQFPNAGFHQRLVAFTGQQFLRQPWNPLPMMRW
jgi:hypothetical protein